MTTVSLVTDSGRYDKTLVEQHLNSPSEIDKLAQDEERIREIATFKREYKFGELANDADKTDEDRHNVAEPVENSAGDGSLSDEDPDLDDYVLKLVEECQSINNIRICDEVTSGNMQESQCYGSIKSKESMGFHNETDNQSAVSITNIDMPGYMGNSPRNKDLRRNRAHDVLKGSNRKKTSNSGVFVASNSCHHDRNCDCSSSTMVNYYDFSAHNDCSIRRHAGIESIQTAESSQTFNLLSPERLGIGMENDRFNWKRLLRLFEKGADNSLDSPRISTRRGQLQDGHVHSSIKSSQDDIDEALLSVSGSSCCYYSELSAKSRLAALSCSYKTPSQFRRPWNATHSRQVSNTPGELSIMLGRAMNRKQTLHRHHKKHTSHSADSYMSPHVEKSDVVQMPIAITSPKKTCRISVHLPVSHSDDNWDMKSQIGHSGGPSGRPSGGPSVVESKSDPSLDIEGHFPPTIHRSPVRSGKLSAGKLASENHNDQDEGLDDRGERSITVIKLPLVSPDGSLMSGGTLHKHQYVSPESQKSFQNPHRPDTQSRRESEDIRPDAPPGTPASNRSPTPWTSDNVHHTTGNSGSPSMTSPFQPITVHIGSTEVDESNSTFAPSSPDNR